MNKKIHVLITGCGAPGGPGLIQALKLEKNFVVHGCDTNNEASGKFLCDFFFVVPHSNHPEFIRVVENYCRTQRIEAILPLVTAELLIFSENKTYFKTFGTNIIISEWSALSIAINKARLYQHLQKNQIRTPKFEIIEAGNSLQLEQAVLNLGYPKNEIVVKPAFANGSRGVRILSQSVDDFDRLFNHKPESLYTNLESYLKAVKYRDFPELVVSEMLPGEEFSVDCLVNDGEINLILPRLRKKMSGGISIAGEFINDPDIINYCAEILSVLKLHGNIGIQVKRGGDGFFYVLEINPRLQGTSCAALGVNVNIPVLSVNLVLNNKISIPEIVWKTKFVRYWETLYFH